MNLLGRTKIVQSYAPVTSNTTITTTEIDCRGFDRVCHIINVGAIVSGGTLNYKVQEAAASNGTFGDIEDAELTQVEYAGRSNVYAIDIPVNPLKPFQKAVATAATQNVTSGAVAVLYEGSGTYPKDAAKEAIIL
jgi:hypothetical protein